MENFTLIINDSSKLGYIHESASRKSLSYIDKMKRKYGFTVEYERWNQTYWVEMPKHAEDLAWDINHHLRDEHGCYSQSEIVQRFEAMAEFMEEYCMEDA